MCNEHGMLRNVALMHASTAAYMINYQGMFTNANFQWQMDSIKNCVQCCFTKFDCRLFLSKFVEITFYLSLSLSVISKSLAQSWCKCCSLSISIVLNVRFTTNGMCMMNNTHVARTSRNEMITTWDLYCCLVQQWKGLRTFRSAFEIITKWCFDQQDVKVCSSAKLMRATT